MPVSSTQPAPAARMTESAAPDLPALFEAEEGPLLRYAFGLLGRRVVAEEVVQEAFLRLHREWEGVRNPRPWLYRCVRNLAYNEHRDQAREVLSEDAGKSEPHPQAAPDEELGRHEAIGTLRLLLSELDPDDARLIDLKYRQQQNYAAIAATTGLTIGNVGYKLHHLLKSLAQSLRQAGIDRAEA
jgi:RNA polymerase sigma-70 factor (ECF subfamily)